MSEDMYDCLADILVDTKSTVAHLKQSKGEVFNGGNYNMILTTLKTCQILISSEKSGYICAQFILNTVVISYGTFQKSCYQPFESYWVVWWLCYHFILFYFYKGYQEGVNRNEPWHICSNSICPEIFPVFALSNYMLTYPASLKGYFHLFPGES